MMQAMWFARRAVTAIGGHRAAHTAAKGGAKEPIVVVSCKEKVCTIRMNNPRKYNAWDRPMMTALFDAFDKAAADDQVKAIILTGTGKYYCAGVNLAGTISPMHPAQLFKMIKSQNQMLFDQFLNLNKPILVAANGPAIGASVTSAALCDGIVAAPGATFSTPFKRLAVTPEGCSSANFPTIMGDDNARRMLYEDWAPTAAEAKDIGLITDVVDDDALLSTAQKICEGWVRDGKTRTVDPAWFDVNKKESADLGKAFLSDGFLRAQMDFLNSKGKTQMSWAFWAILSTRPVWSQFLPAEAR